MLVKLLASDKHNCGAAVHGLAIYHKNNSFLLALNFFDKSDEISTILVPRHFNFMKFIATFLKNVKVELLFD